MRNEKKVLEGIRVADFGQYIAGPLASMILADFGADVIHIDPPKGPMADWDANAVLMRGKRNISLDLKKKEDLDIAKKIIESCDIVIENFRSGVMERLGIGPKACTENDPSLIYCSIPGFSSKDEKRKDWQGWEGIVSAEAGLYRVSRFGMESDSPVFYSLTIASDFAAMIAVHSIMAALIVREKCGKGQIIEAPLYDACFEAAGIFGRDPKGKPPVSAKPNPKDSFRGLSGFACKDGRYIQLSPPKRGIKNLWDYFIPEDIEDITPEIRERIAEKFKERTMAEWERFGQDEMKAGITSVFSSEEWLHDDYALKSRSVIRTEDPVLGEIYSPGYAVYMSKTPGATDHVRHLPDADRNSIISELDDAKKAHDAKVFGKDNAPKEALEGVKILDLCQILAGPIAARIASEYGARVIKVNNPRTFENPTAMAGHDTVNNGKATTFIDLKSDEGRALLFDLVKDADVFHCNFTFEALKRLGIDEESLRKVNPNIIVSQVNVHSIGGFRENYRGHEELGEAVTGMSVRQSGDGKGQALPITYCDNSTGCLSNIAILMALYHRMRTGEPQFVQASLSRSGSVLQLPYMLSYSSKVWDEPTGPGIKGWSAFNRLYKTSDEWIWVYSEKRIEKLLKLCKVETSLKDPEKALEEAFSAKPAEEWIKTLKDCGIEACLVRDFCKDSMEEPYAIERGLSVRKDHKGLGVIRTIGSSPRLSLTPNHAAVPVSAPGSDSDMIKEEKWNFDLKG